MNPNWTALAPALILLALTGASCSTGKPRSILSEKEALALAVQRANDEAMRLFEIQPFRSHHGEMQRVDNGWQWQALVGVGKADLLGKVSLPADGSGGTTSVEMFTSFPFGMPTREQVQPYRSEPRILGPPERMEK